MAQPSYTSSYIPHPEPRTRNPKPETRNLRTSTLKPQTLTLTPHPSPLTPQTSTLNPLPSLNLATYDRSSGPCAAPSFKPPSYVKTLTRFSSSQMLVFCTEYRGASATSQRAPPSDRGGSALARWACVASHRGDPQPKPGRARGAQLEHVCIMLCPKAVTLPNIGVPLYIGVPQRVTEPPGG